MTLKILAHLSLSAQVATKQETLIVATYYSLILLQFLFQYYVLRARSNWRKPMRSPGLYCIVYIFCFNNLVMLPFSMVKLELNSYIFFVWFM